MKRQIPAYKLCDLKPLSLKKATEKARVMKQEFYFKNSKGIQFDENECNVGCINHGVSCIFANISYIN